MRSTSLDSILDFVCRFLAEEFSLESDHADSEASLSSFPRWDSISAISLLTAVEERFKIELDPVKFYESKSAKDISEQIAGLIAEKTPD